MRDWSGAPLFPGRQVNEPIIIDLGRDYRRWLQGIHDLFEPAPGSPAARAGQGRAAGWRRGQALQWASSSVQAGLGYLAR